MAAPGKPKVRISPSLWRAARALYVSDPMMSLPRIAERFGLSPDAVRKRSSRERWRGRVPNAEGSKAVENEQGGDADAVPIVTAEDFRAFVRSEAVALLRDLRKARRTAGDRIEAVKAITPCLEQLSRLADGVFDHPVPKGLHRSIFEGGTELPPEDFDPASDAPEPCEATASGGEP